jgi:hypothetical protein
MLPGFLMTNKTVHFVVKKLEPLEVSWFVECACNLLEIGFEFVTDVGGK